MHVGLQCARTAADGTSTLGAGEVDCRKSMLLLRALHGAEIAGPALGTLQWA